MDPPVVIMKGDGREDETGRRRKRPRSSRLRLRERESESKRGPHFVCLLEKNSATSRAQTLSSSLCFRLDDSFCGGGGDVFRESLHPSDASIRATAEGRRLRPRNETLISHLLMKCIFVLGISSSSTAGD
ncbi:hypothetical protein B296_00046460 [Ensete ventricosum]|uniref:Uncharacterized protein n=1 Tax=Ensete ventricosum TaxID=4639 RepID=A0A426XSN0_ENSVE|nr:hypothetical protein B296_00046460 [Ensete ventricosum]